MDGDEVLKQAAKILDQRRYPNLASLVRWAIGKTEYPPSERSIIGKGE